MLIARWYYRCRFVDAPSNLPSDMFVVECLVSFYKGDKHLPPPNMRLFQLELGSEVKED